MGRYSRERESQIPTLSRQAFAGGDGIAHQHGNRHWTNSSGNWGYRFAHRSYGVEVDIANKTVAGFGRRILDTVDADIDDDGAFLDMFGSERLGSTDSCNDDVGAAGDSGEIFCP
jgi:hypothetical protein